MTPDALGQEVNLHSRGRDEFVFRQNRRHAPMAGLQTLLGLGTHREPTTYEGSSGSRPSPARRERAGGRPGSRCRSAVPASRVRERCEVGVKRLPG